MDDDLQRAAAANADAVVRRFFGADGRLTTLPAKQSRQLAVYDLIAQRFIPGVRYTEVEVNRELMAIYDDYVTLRRGLIDFGLMDRSDGQYWRSGGSVPIGVGTTGGPATTGAITGGIMSTIRTAPSPRGAARREAILTAAAQLFAESGYAAVGMDDIGAAAGVTGPAIYRHFGAKASVLTAVFGRVIDAVTTEPDGDLAGEADDDPQMLLRRLIHTYAIAVSGRRRLMAVFIREVHHLPSEDRDLLVARQRALVGRWRSLLGQVHPDWDSERVRTAVHGAFGMVNAVGTFESPLSDQDLAGQLSALASTALEL
jgi:AcrR family transcriptional regulator